MCSDEEVIIWIVDAALMLQPLKHDDLNTPTFLFGIHNFLKVWVNEEPTNGTYLARRSRPAGSLFSSLHIQLIDHQPLLAWLNKEPNNQPASFQQLLWCVTSQFFNVRELRTTLLGPCSCGIGCRRCYNAVHEPS